MTNPQSLGIFTKILLSTFQSSTEVALSLLGVYATLKTLPQFIPRLSIVPRSLRSLLVSHCKRCPEYTRSVCFAFSALSCSHTHRKYDVVFRSLSFFGFEFSGVHTIQRGYVHGVGYLVSTVYLTYWYYTLS